MKNKFAIDYNPLLFLAALGNGGLAVSFFTYLMFLIKHPDTPVPTYSHIQAVLTGGDLPMALMTAAALLGIAFFSVQHIRLLAINQWAYLKFRKTIGYEALKASNNEINLMAIPLTYGMLMNVLLILGALFVPGLWNVVEFLFPFVLVAYGLIGAYALRLFSIYFSRLLLDGDFDFIRNNSLSQLLSSFAFMMIAVGFAAAGAMSRVELVSVTGILAAVFFATISLLLLGIKMVLGFKSMFRQGISKESVPSLWIIIPIMTLLGITLVRIGSGIYHNILHGELPPVVTFALMSILVSIQGISGLIGFLVLKKSNYFSEYLNGDRKSAGSYSLVCPGVGAAVLGMFFIHWGFVKTGLVVLFSPAHLLLILPVLVIQILTIRTLWKINRKLLV